MRKEDTNSVSHTDTLQTGCPFESRLALVSSILIVEEERVKGVKEL
jgi:hypothetical protein